MPITGIMTGRFDNRKLLAAGFFVGGITLTENAGMIALARKLGFHVHLEHGNATVTDLRWEAEGAESALIEGSSLPTQPSAPQRGASGSGS